MMADEGRHGPVSFEQFMDDALYGPEGFYATHGRAGRRGDFITSPEVGPLFGAVLARWVDDAWRRAGSPDDFTVVEAGAGPGTLARTLRGPFRYVAVEVSAAQRALHPEWVESAQSMPAEPFRGVVIANELLDNLPFRLAVFDGAWREAFVRRDGDRCREVLSAPFDPLPAHLPPTATHGARAPLQRRAHDWVVQARAVADRVLVFDYCTARTAELTGRPWREWLRTYRGHERGQHYLADSGTQDITAQVCLDQLPEPDAVRSQAQFLLRWGIDELVAEGAEAWKQSAAAPTLESLRMRSRVSESEALLDPNGLGSFTAIEWSGTAAVASKSRSRSTWSG
jgi:SAM-dependent MidA family methyltransferase